MSGVIACLTAVSLRIVDARLHQRLKEAARLELRRSLSTFEDAESERLQELQRENALLADLPSLKALMTTADNRTIEDGGTQFWRTSGEDLFALALPTGHVSAVYTQEELTSDSLRRDLQFSLGMAHQRYLVSGHHLYGYSVKPLFFGNQRDGTLLGRVITGYVIDSQQLAHLANASGLEAVFLSGDKVLASSLSAGPALPAGLQSGGDTDVPEKIVLAGEPFATVSQDLSPLSTSPLRLLLLRSLRRDEAQTREIDRLLALIAVCTGLVGAALMLLVANGMTRSLSVLAQGVEAFGRGEPNVFLPTRGPREVLQLSNAFAAMRQQVEDSNRALLEAERLATIGRMARSVSHDLRHHLSAVYANAEFLAMDRLTVAERNDLLEEIRLAVLGTTDLIESLLLFSRTGQPSEHHWQDFDSIIRRATETVQRHPESAAVALRLHTRPGLLFVHCDGAQVERALCNLILNASQAARGYAAKPVVHVQATLNGEMASVRITDNGGGIAGSVRDSLFQPFISEGKQNGTGLGLTLAFQVACDHGGTILVECSSPGETCFCFSIADATSQAPHIPAGQLVPTYDKHSIGDVE